MRKSLSVFFFMLLYVTIAFGQATVDIPLSGTDGTITIPLAVGLDPTATNGIDPQLGESDLPPFPPQGVFDIRFDLTPYAGEPLSSLKDYRYAPSFPYTGADEHLLWWQTSAPSLPINVQYDLPNGAAMTLRDQLGGVILNLGPFTGSGTVTIPGTYTNIFAKCLVLMDYNVVPVELTSFTATVIGNAVQLNWHTATELNNQGFEIERKAEGDWVRIGYVPGFGTTTEPRNYSFSDENVSKGTYTYRLKQLDFGGGFTYSDEVSVEVDFTPTEYALSQNYPNPFNPSTTILYQVPKAGDVSIVIYNMLGQEVRTLFNGQIAAGSYEVQWNGLNDAGTKMSSGSYIYRMTAGDFVESKEMILLK
jgi:FlgD Ig-like domain